MTEKKDFPVFRVGIVTLSDKGYQGEREDKSGPKIKELLPAEQYEVVSMRLLPDERAMIEEELIRLADLEQCDLVLTTGGTGFSMRDVTPEATLAVSGRVAPGIAEAIRAGSMAITKRAMLSRAVSAIRHRTLIINLPGSPKAVEESLGFVLDTLPHALGLLRGTDGECGGCTAKLGAGVLEHILEKLPKGEKDPNLLVGYDSKDDASVYRLTDDLAMVQTLDFFPPVVEDPYTFGKIAAANALSDIYAMGGEVRTALNIVCFPEQMDLNVLGEIMRGGAEKVQEAGGSLSGGHSIADDSVKYGLSVTGTVHPDRIWQNNTGRVGDLLILTKPLGTGILCAAHRVGEENPGGFQKAVESMMTLNKYASETARKYNIHACTDVTGFSFLGHLHEMMESGVSCHIWADQIPVFPGAVEAAEEFLITAAGQRNRNHLEQHVTFKDIPFGMQEVLFDPQTSGGLLMAVDAVDAEKMQRKLLEQGIPAAIVGKITEPAGTEIYVTQSRKW